jgi:hypothetical protein
MDSQASQLTLGLLPEPRTRWGRFMLSYGVQSVVVAFFVIAAMVYPEVLVAYRCTTTTSSAWSALRLRFRKTPAPVKHFPVPAPKISEPVTPRPEAMRVPTELVQKKPPVPEEQAPKVTLAAKKEVLPDEAVDSAAAGQDECVFHRKLGDAHHGGRARESTDGWLSAIPMACRRDNHGRPVTIAQAGSFDMPSGPGYGNGTGGSHGARGVVASTGFGSGVATGNSSGPVSGSRGTVRQGGFGDADVVAASPAKTKSADPVVKPCRPRSHSSPVRFTLMKGDSLRLRARFCSMSSFQQPGRFAS